MISGVSAGAIVGAYYAAGFSFDDMVKIIRETELYHLLDLRFLKAGLFKSIPVKESLERHLKGIRFEDLKLPLTVVATDFQNGKSIYFSKGEVVPALLASSAIPVLYQPVEYEDMILVDGGLLNNFPVEPIAGVCDAIVGIHLNPLNAGDVRSLNLASAVDRCMHLAFSNNVNDKKQQCTVFIEPPGLHRFGVFDMDVADEIVKIGYDYANGMQKEIEISLSGIA